MRPIIKSFVYFDRHPEGVYFRAGGEVFIMKGKGIYPVVVKIVSLMDGTRDLDSLSSRLPEKLRPLLDILLRELVARNFVIDGGPVETSDIAAVESRPEPAAFLADYVPQPMATFGAWCRRPLLVIGSGAVANAAVRALAGLGVEELYCWNPSGELLDIGSSARSVTRADIGVLSVHAVLYAADNIDLELLASLPDGIWPVAVAGQLGEHVMVASGDQLRNRDVVGRLRVEHASSEVVPSSSQRILAGNLLAHEWFLSSTGVASVFAPMCKLIASDLSVTEVVYDPLGVNEKIPPPKHPDRQLTDFELFWEGLKPLFAEATGLFELVDDQALFQIPLSQRELMIVTPPLEGRARVRGWGLGFEEASRSAIKRAVERHAEGMSAGLLMARAGFSREEARARFAASLAYGNEESRASAHVIMAVTDDLSDEATVLWRIAQQVAPRPFHMRLLSWDDRGGAVAELMDEDGVMIWEAEANAEEALRQALGTYCSCWQNGDPIRPTYDRVEMLNATEVDIETYESFGLFLVAATVPGVR